MTSPATASVRDLISELAQVEDAVRRTPTLTEDPSAPVHPELSVLVARHHDIVRELRRRRMQWRDACAPGHSIGGPTP